MIFAPMNDDRSCFIILQIQPKKYRDTGMAWMSKLSNYFIFRYTANWISGI